MFQLREILFDKLDSFSSHYSDDQNLFKNIALFDFESICLQENNFRDTDTTTWIGKHVQISVSISLNLIAQPIFLCNSHPGALVESFLDALDELATQGKVQMKLNFLEAENSVNSKLNQNFSALNQRRCRMEAVLEFEDECSEEEEEEEKEEEEHGCRQFLQTQKYQLMDLQDHLGINCNVVPVFGFNSAKYDNNFIRIYLLPLLVNERGIEPRVIKKANQFGLYLSSLEKFSC